MISLVKIHSYAYNRSTNCENNERWYEYHLARMVGRIIEVESWRLPFHSTLRYRLHADAVISSLVGFSRKKGSCGEVCLVSRDKIPQLCVSRNPNENVASVKRESRFRVSEGGEDPLTRSISIQPLSSTIVSLRRDRRAKICPTPGRSTNRIRSECPHPSIVISSTARIIRSVRLNKTIVRATTARNSSIPISYLPLLRSVQQKRFSTTAVFYRTR